MDSSEYLIGGFQLGNLLLAFAISATFVFLLYWLWTWPCGSNSEECKGINAHKYKTILPDERVKPLYALELEPGIVVLQSEDGEFFRILREYESVEKKGRGSTSSDLPIDPSEHHYIPSYTRAHFQTRPSAPLLPHDNDSLLSQGGCDPFGDGASWTPIQTVSRET